MNKPSLHFEADPDHRVEGGRSLFVKAQDGLRLHIREYGDRNSPGIPVVCLPGLARTTADFDVLAPALAKGPPERHVIAIDSRGRGYSEHDTDHTNYNCMTELGDIVSILFELGVGPAVFVGSSRGGVLSMLLGATHPTAVAGVLLHDVGPVTECKGLARIKSYIGKLPIPRDFEEGAEILRRLMSTHFPKFTPEQWICVARRTWHLRDDGLLCPAYDVKIAQALAAIDVEGPLPTLWNEFDSLADVPMMVVRGANSDILSAETVEAMQARRKRLNVIEVQEEGHAPLLEGDELLGQIVQFVEECQAEHRERTRERAVV
jgi:pimeloyl-ACP methyl ester carboxylesterase